VPDSYEKDYARRSAAYQEKLRERARRIKADRAARDADGQSSAAATPYSTATSTYPYPPMPPSARIMFLAYGTNAEQLLNVIDGLLALLPYKPAPSATNDPVVLLVRRARKAMRNKDPRGILHAA
jgi:hypothetical protein